MTVACGQSKPPLRLVGSASAKKRRMSLSLFIVARGQGVPRCVALPQWSELICEAQSAWLRLACPKCSTPHLQFQHLGGIITLFRSPSHEDQSSFFVRPWAACKRVVRLQHHRKPLKGSKGSVPESRTIYDETRKQAEFRDRPFHGSRWPVPGEPRVGAIRVARLRTPSLARKDIPSHRTLGST